MHNYEYKTVRIKGNFKSDSDLIRLDKTINGAAQDDWELASTTAVANSFWGIRPGDTSAILLTFRRAHLDMV
ncbi:DUF4177 domain-containing protein [Neolewinella antarctica]|uniref:DUF4177 domain-containing protein n=1 Tax=Neolewinella antarctica TaxID=442734 RepID=A0ABX0XC67_9BACT|nr:DUF4177 domain-containing protein [Neolewinella antarctica]NJC26859.1 hypothetical protein [Neolewinella antarctica]